MKLNGSKMPGDHVAHGPRSASGVKQVGLLPLAPIFLTPLPAGEVPWYTWGELKSCARVLAAED